MCYGTTTCDPLRFREGDLYFKYGPRVFIKHTLIRTTRTPRIFPNPVEQWGDYREAFGRSFNRRFSTMARFSYKLGGEVGY